MERIYNTQDNTNRIRQKTNTKTDKTGNNE